MVGTTLLVLGLDFLRGVSLREVSQGAVGRVQADRRGAGDDDEEGRHDVPLDSFLRPLRTLRLLPGKVLKSNLFRTP